MASIIVALAEAIKSNHQLSSKVSDVLAKLLRPRLDCDEMVGQCKDLLKEKSNLDVMVESTAAKKEKLAKVVSYLRAWLKESKFKLGEFELRASKETEVNK